MENTDATSEDVVEAGIQLMVAVYGGAKDDKLSTMRYQSYCSKVCALLTSMIPEQFPPTERAAVYHAFLVHQQTVVWKALDNRSIDPCKWGWHLVNGRLDPIASDQCSVCSSDYYLLTE